MKDWERRHSQIWANRHNIRFMKPIPRQSSAPLKDAENSWFAASLVGLAIVVVLVVLSAIEKFL